MSEPDDRGGQASDAVEARRFAAAFRGLSEWAHSVEGLDGRNEVAGLVADVLGPPGAAYSVVSRELPPFDQVNLQSALDAWRAESDRHVEVHGFALPPHYPGVTLQQLVAGEAMPAMRLTAPALIDLANGPHSTLACLTRALLVVTDPRGRYVLLVRGPSEREPGLFVEVAGLPTEAAQAVLAEVDRLRSELNVYRGQLLDVSINPMGGVVLGFLDPPVLERAQVVLPEAVLVRIERHAVAIAEHSDALLAAGQHLKRGLLLYGPPGTGKTHTTRYLLGQMTHATRLILTGRSLAAIGSVTDMARELAPAVVVLEDVDLVAEDRGFGLGSNPLLFDLLDAMDGAAPDADLLFLLTTNRADLLEPALAARPGRVDVAVQIPLPDADARARLLALYTRDLPLRLADNERRDVIERSDGVTASFLKELARRAALEALDEDPALAAVTGEHLIHALDELLDSTQTITRSLLGVGVDPETLPPSGPAPVPTRVPRRGKPAAGWTAYGPLRRY